MNAKTTEAAGVAGALAVLEQVKGVVFNFAPRSLSTELAAALATLQSRLLAADELREAAGKLPLHIADCYVAGEASGDEYDDWKDGTAALSEALAAYDKAGGLC